MTFARLCRAISWDGIYRGIQSDENVFARYAQSPEPENRYKVGFWNENTLLKLEHVMEGGDAAAPEAPRREGYEFTRWSPSYSNVKGDLMVTAQYRAKAPKPDDRLERITDALSRLDMPEDVRIGFINLAGVLIENETKPHARTGFLLFSLGCV